MSLQVAAGKVVLGFLLASSVLFSPTWSKAQGNTASGGSSAPSTDSASSERQNSDAGSQQQPRSAGSASSSTQQQTPDEKEKDRGALGEVAQPKNNGAQETENGTSKDRLFYALPNFLTVENGTSLPPLTARQKFGVVVRGSFDYVQYPWYGFLAGLSQAENSEPGYGQGAEGYAKRYGAAFADGTIENFMTGAILPSLLHQDPRYFQLGHGSFTHRVIYAASRNLITRGDDKHREFNYSEVVGGAISAFVSTYSYHPAADQTVSNTMKVWGTQYGYDTITLVVKEFWPDIRRKLSHKKHLPEPAPDKASQ